MPKYWVQYATVDGNGKAVEVQAIDKNDAEKHVSELNDCVEVLEVTEA